MIMLINQPGGVKKTVAQQYTGPRNIYDRTTDGAAVDDLELYPTVCVD